MEILSSEISILSGDYLNNRNREWNDFLYNPDKYRNVITLCYPSDTLKKAGMYDLPVKAKKYTVTEHFVKHKDVHPQDLKNLPMLLCDPLMVFAYEGKNKYQGSLGFSIVVKLTGEKYLVIGIHPVKDKDGLQYVINSLRTFHWRDNKEINYWIDDNKLLYADINKLKPEEDGDAISPITTSPGFKILGKYKSKISDGKIYVEENIKNFEKKLGGHLSGLLGLGITNTYGGFIVPDGHEATYSETDWDRLISPATGLSGFVKNGDVSDTVDAIHNIILNNYRQVCHLAQYLKADSDDQTFYNIYHWLRTHIAYHNDDPGTEQLRTPARSWMDRYRGVDCDDYSIFVASLLLCLGYNPQLIIVAYHGNPNYAHIFVGVPKDKPVTGLYYDKNVLNRFNIIDPVYYRYNSIIPYITKVKIYKPMKIEILSGIPAGMPLAGLGYGHELPPDEVSKAYLNRYDRLGGRHKRIADLHLALNRSVWRLPYALVGPYMHDITPDGHIVWKSEELGRLAESFLTDVENQISGLMGLYGVEGLGSWWSRVKKGVSHAWHKTKDAIHTAAQKAKQVGSKVWKGTKKVALAPARNAYLALLYMNAFGFATKWYLGLMSWSEASMHGLPKPVWERRKAATIKLLAFWKRMGGDPEALKRAILKGKSHKPLLAPTARKMYDAGIRGLGSATAATLATTASAIITAVGKWLKENWQEVAKFVGNAVSKMKKGGGGSSSSIDTKALMMPGGGDFEKMNVPGKTTSDDGGSSGGGNNKWLLLAGLGIAAAVMLGKH